MPLARTSDGAELHYEIVGSGEILFLVPGLAGLASFWAEQVPRFARRYRVLTYDHRGAGRSTRSRIDYSVAQMANDALAVLDAAGFERVHLIGHSTGGCIGQVIAIDRPGRLISLGISSSWAAADPYFRRLFEARKRILLDGGPAAYVRTGTLFQYPPEWIVANSQRLETAEQAAILDFPDPAIVVSKIEAILRFDRTDDLGRIRLPVFVHAASDDLICPPHMSRDLARRIPGARSATIDGGHFCPRTKPDEYFRSVSALLHSLPDGGHARRAAEIPITEEPHVKVI